MSKLIKIFLQNDSEANHSQHGKKLNSEEIKILRDFS
tara:strand:- start:124 stop:234 length:111 start_codon:yes stop_codon:yes gene_type:complete